MVTERQLVNWIKTQKSFCVDLRRRKLLESLPGWEWAVPADVAWDTGFQYLKKYISVIPKNKSWRRFKTEDGYALGSWINRQHRLFSLRNSEPELFLSEDRIKKLESVRGWKWDVEYLEWRFGYFESVKYGTVDKDFVTPDGYLLGLWQNAQRVRPSKYIGRRKRLELYVSGWHW